jgi:flagellar biosynthesis protein FlhG
MSKLLHDQAAGLRRIMAAPAPRVVTIVSAASVHDKSRLMTNLAASIANQDNNPLVICASKESSETFYGINNLATLVEIAGKPSTLPKAIYHSQHGFSIAKLMQKSQLELTLTENMSKKLNLILDELTQQYDILLVDASINKKDMLPLSCLNEGEILIQLTRKAESITDAYTLIKKIYSQIGRRHFGIIVDDATELQAKKVYDNIHAVAKRYMQIDLEFFGAIPNDDHLNKATQLGRSVIEAFPLASASTAFRKMAQKFNYQQTSVNNFKQVALV